ncbi:MAG TPA: universal stress protein [Acidobacteriaceae bacterium]|nr:universal stress protein [Acidobacteriaceae bacterium]
MTLLQKPPASSLAAPGRIVVSTDLTDTEYLLPHAIAQAKVSGASLILVHAVLPHESVPMESGAIPYYDPLRLDRDARLILENLAREVRDKGVECATAVRHGFVPDVVAEVVANTGAGRLILGTHGRRGLKKFVLGSVARQLLEAVDIPVCTVGPRAHKSVTRQPATILHPVSLAGSHEASASLSFRLGEQFGARVVLLHVLQPAPHITRDPERAIAVATEDLDRLVPEEAKPSTQVQARIAVSSVVSEILNAASESQAGLIVLGVHAPSHSWLPGTEPAAYKILVSAPCPVISLRVHPAPEKLPAEQKEEGHPAVFG